MNIPKHIAFIMDGNGRWAKERGLTRTKGHEKGFRNLINVADACLDMGVEAITCYAFSTENWNRPKLEVAYLMEIPTQINKENKDEFNEKNIKIKFIGRRDRFPKRTLRAIKDLENSTKDNTKMTICIAFDYGSHNEIITSIKDVAKDVLNGMDVNDINETYFESKLSTFGLPKIDLLVRTSGENRISNFLMWQLAYSELYFPETYWPDFDKVELQKAIEEYSRRNRRFGTIKED